ncbi:sensor histidine kinase [Pseudobacter ginsenosidimutans]|uniref:Two component regulator with propeller domain n=1 Tax=Pseudobacter ginsenosidimutans TaxID=661488 RepID=A0A4Q7MTY6_9BACT|nr:histidine kinase [Pseudobacter ginsenosidimutans]QEC41142.1 hypothetical protein FSB84_05315 [Pseudobacter ginsenosidimutans]RZS72097.1 two component regulator with propeller domain [Pseudobacter ginsenosidimutans]
MLRILHLLVFLLSVVTANAQDYNYIQYTVADGLPSNTIYDVKQDIDGFIWLATDAGLVRFDGRKFTTFTQKEGLPSNDVIILFSDSKGRTWIISMHNTICYYYKGKIYNYRNDSACSKMRFPSMPYYMAENKNGEMGFLSHGSQNEQAVFILRNNNQVISNSQIQSTFRHSSIDGDGPPDKFRIFYYDTSGKRSVAYLFDGKWKHAWTHDWDEHSNYLRKSYMVNGKLKLMDSTYVQDIKRYTIHSTDMGDNISFIEKAPQHPRISIPPEGKRLTVYQSTNNGVYFNDPVTGKITDHLLPGKVTNRCYRDLENNIWIGTHAEGVWILPSKSVKNILLKQPKADILSFFRSGNTLFAGSDYGNLFNIRNKQLQKSENFDHYIQLANNKDANNRLHWIEPGVDGLIFGFDDFILKYDPATSKQLFSKIDVNKFLSVAGKDSLLAATGRATLLINSNTLSILDTIWPYRSYSAIKQGNAYYIGTPGGLLKVVPGIPAIPMGNIHPDLQALVNRMFKTDDGSIWMSTTGNGVVHLRNDSIIQKFNTSNGLTSNNCKALHLDDKFVWVGTEKGLNRIDRSFTSAPVQHYTIEDGLPSNDIHSIISDSGTLYIGTIGKITYFDTSSLHKPSFCSLRLLSMEAGKQTVNPDSLQTLKHNENSLKFEYTGISFNSPKNITYYYRLKGQSVSWDSTLNTNLEFVSLPPGDYTFELFARNKAGINSNTLTVPFIIKPAFWGTWWFRLLVALILVTIVWLLVIRRIRQEQNKSATQNRINELEQLALRSQMNPHFIFNCLNSIQNFLLQNNFEKTNEYLTSFAHLIRQTLDNSSRSTISIESESRYLSSYLELESMRFGHSFIYDIEVDPAIDPDNTFIPTMILQPYVENSIRHGLRYRQDGVKSVRVIFRKRGNTLVCIVEDNGIGRKKAAELKSFMHVEYQSKGMTLTAERIAALNRRQDIPITVDVIDMEEDGNATGTQVIVRFPNVFL